MTYAVHMAMEALHTLYERGSFDESTHSREMVKKLRRASDSVQAFLDEMICCKEGGRIARSQMFNMYEDYCSDNGRQPLSKSRFFLTMERKGYTISKYQGIFRYRDVAVRDSDFESADGEEIPFDTTGYE